MNTPNNVRLLPPTRDQNFLAACYSLADAFVICSDKENFPTTCIEAQCCGTPIFGFDAGGTKETSLIGTDNFVAYGDLDALKGKLQEVLLQEHPGLAERAFQEYSAEAMYRNYLTKEYDRTGKKQRILMIDIHCKNSSTGKIVYDLASKLRKDGREAAVCHGRGPEVKEPGVYKFGLDWETNLHALLARVTGYNGCFSPLSTRRLIRYIEDFKPDLIHIHELHAYFVNLKPLLTYIKKKNIPVVWTFHCEYMYTGRCGIAYDCTGYHTGCRRCPNIREYPKSLFFDHAATMFRWKQELLRDLDMTIVTPSQWLASRVKLSFLKDKPLRVIHNGINTDIFHPVDAAKLRADLQIPEGARVILALAPDIMLPEKGGQWVLQLAEQMLGENIVFVLVGDPSQKTAEGKQEA